ncbi:predicted protein [Sclerotinia sclerotiorum 1980 UF-70]|uniref:Uncharacterized protein n=1 Tax=Sclerotinia sclerotiorum (strain ATCC 18683 / 1980 / Ss-1) TaxID=665079 RepID=A7EFU0_SCLS1|nr:predicted protein [Sclerotinia sclerotiorum 1980 UF-70]EDO01706.1 predicted protein [Sclerotinia sclerotiorum 1980 UF-70]
MNKEIIIGTYYNTATFISKESNPIDTMNGQKVKLLPLDSPPELSMESDMKSSI